jgi:putative DNA primase/helicase
LNINENEFVLVIAFLLAALQPQGPYPIFALIGEQGASKTSLVRMLRSLVDPSSVPSGALPFSGRDLYIAAHNAHIQAFENVSKLSDLMSDHLCRLATGGGIRTRAVHQQ